MKVISPSVEYWRNQDNKVHVERCARVCYASDLRYTGTLYDKLVSMKHLSMFRHETHYFRVPSQYMVPELGPFVNIERTPEFIYVSVNGQWARENQRWINLWDQYRVQERDIIGTGGESVIRRTFCIVTQISTSRELNRVSPNNIAERSTRYVDFGKKGGIKICGPHWYWTANWFVKFIARCGWRLSALFYNIMKLLQYAPQDAREFLPLCAATKVVYTYSLKEWKHILELRYHGTTGKPHPNAYKIASDIVEILNEQGFSKFTEYIEEPKEPKGNRIVK